MTRVVAILVVIISFLVLFRARHQAAHLELVEQAVAEARDVNGGTAWFTQVPSSEAMCQ